MSAFSEPFAGLAIARLLGLPEDVGSDLAHDATALGLAMRLDCKRHGPVFDAACDRLMQFAAELLARASRARRHQLCCAASGGGGGHG